MLRFPGIEQAGDGDSGAGSWVWTGFSRYGFQVPGSGRASGWRTNPPGLLLGARRHTQLDFFLVPPTTPRLHLPYSSLSYFSSSPLHLRLLDRW